MKVLLNQIEWHDAIITEMTFTSTHDAFDRFIMQLKSEAFLDDFGKQEISVVLHSCYKIRVDLNLWIKGMDSISEVKVQTSSPWIKEEKERLTNGFGPKELLHFEVSTNSNSKIEILLTQDDCIELIP